MSITDLDMINNDLMTTQVPNAFGKDAQPGDELSGVIVEAERRHRHNGKGEPLFWVDRKPSTTESGQPVMDSVLIVQTELEDGPEDDGRRYLRMDRDVKQALAEAIRAAGAKGVELGGVIEGFKFHGQAANGRGRHYIGGTYTPPQS